MTKALQIGEEVKGSKLAMVKWVEEMLPIPAAENQMWKSQPKIGEEQYNIIEQCLRLDATIEDACMAAWISVASYYKHRDKNPDFARRMDIAKEFPKMSARAAVQRRILQWDAKTALRYLELRDRRYKPEHIEEAWGEKTRVEFTLVPTIEWADQIKNDIQKSIKQNSAYEWFASSWEPEKLTPWENENQILENLSS